MTKQQSVKHAGASTSDRFGREVLPVHRELESRELEQVA